MKVGTVTSIWRYPVKGMAGERLQRSIVRQADQNLGIYGNILNAGLINIGDEARLV